MLLYCTKGEKKKKKKENCWEKHIGKFCSTNLPDAIQKVQQEDLKMKLRTFFFFGIEKALTVNMRMIKTMLSHCFPLFIYQFVISWSCNQIVKPLGWRPTSCTVFAEAMPTAALIFQ